MRPVERQHTAFSYFISPAAVSVQQKPAWDWCGIFHFGKHPLPIWKRPALTCLFSPPLLHKSELFSEIRKMLTKMYLHAFQIFPAACANYTAIRVVSINCKEQKTFVCFACVL